MSSLSNRRSRMHLLKANTDTARKNNNSSPVRIRYSESKYGLKFDWRKCKAFVSMTVLLWGKSKLGMWLSNYSSLQMIYFTSLSIC